MGRGEYCRGSHLLEIDPWTYNGSGKVQVMGCLCTGGVFCPVRSLWCMEQSGIFPGGIFGMAVLLQGGGCSSFLFHYFP